ncbi:MAG: discoidin domain-containing protein [Vicinamibacterales bacterium]
MARFLYQNRITADGVTVTSSSELTNRPDDYLLSPARWKKWRSATGTGDQWVRFDLGSAQTFQAIALVGWRAHTGGAITVQAHSADLWSSPTVDETLTLPSPNPTGVVVLWLSSVQTLRYVRILFENTGAADEYVELGAVHVAPIYEPTFNVSDDYSFDRTDLSRIVTSDQGHESADPKPQRFRFSGQFYRLPAADRSAFLTMFDAVGVHTPIVFAVDPDEADLTLYGRFLETLRLPHVFQGDVTIPVELIESL